MGDKVAKYEAIILAFLEKQAGYFVANSEMENQLIADYKNHHYQLVRIGWRQKRLVRFLKK